MKQSELAGFGETWRMHLRAARDIRKCCPGLIASKLLTAAVKSLGPYVTVYLSARIIDELAGARRADVLWNLVIAALASGALLTLLGGVLNRWMDAREYAFWHKYNWLYSDKLLHMDFADVDKEETHDLLAQARQAANWNMWGYAMFVKMLEEAAMSAFGITGAAVLMGGLFSSQVSEAAGTLTALNHPATALLFAAALGGILWLGVSLSSRAERRHAGMVSEATFGNRLFSAFFPVGSDEKLAGDIRMYNQQDIAADELLKCNTFAVGGPLSRAYKGSLGIESSVGESMSAVIVGITYLFVCLKAWAGAFGVGAVTQYVGAITALAQNISKLLAAVTNLRCNTKFLDITYQFMDIPNQMYQGSLTTEKRSDRQYEVEFRDVSFRYPDTETWALRHVDMKFRIGSRLAVVGENGSGKSTFIKLLCRLYDPQEGEILLNGIDIRKYKYQDYMQIFSVVFQDFQLLSQPLGANVAGSAQYDAARVRQALQNAGFGDRLETLPKGLDTMLYKEYSEDGVELSGGEEQKVAIARALYKDAPFIILDEPTAALDPIAEAEIYAKFNEISGDRTGIYISHRLSSCKFCDEIAVFDHGCVIQRGTHERLLTDTNGKYYELWQAQAQYYTQETA